MTSSSPVIEGARLLLTQKRYAVEMVESIINRRTWTLVPSRIQRTWECRVFLISLGYVLSNFTLLFVHKLTVAFHF